MWGEYGMNMFSIYSDCVWTGSAWLGKETWNDG